MQSRPPKARFARTLALLQVSRLRDIEFHAREHRKRLARVRAELDESLEMPGHARRVEALMADHSRVADEIASFVSELEDACDELGREDPGWADTR